MIKVEHVSLVIKKKTILDDINAEFSKGQIHGLIGRNGSGKTVLMKCICGFMKPTGGKITVDRQIIGQTCDFPKNTGVIIETPRFINHYSAMKNLKMLASISGLIDTDKIREILNCVGLDPACANVSALHRLSWRIRHFLFLMNRSTALTRTV